MNTIAYSNTSTNTQVVETIQLLAQDATQQRDWMAAMRHYASWLALEPESAYAHAGLARSTSALMDSRSDMLEAVAEQLPTPTRADLVHQWRMYAYVRQAIERELTRL